MLTDASTLHIDRQDLATGFGFLVYQETLCNGLRLLHRGSETADSPLPSNDAELEAARRGLLAALECGAAEVTLETDSSTVVHVGTLALQALTDPACYPRTDPLSLGFLVAVQRCRNVTFRKVRRDEVDAAHTLAQKAMHRARQRIRQAQREAGEERWTETCDLCRKQFTQPARAASFTRVCPACREATQGWAH